MDLPGQSAPFYIPELPTSSGDNSSSGRPSTSIIRSSLSTVRSRSSNGETNHRGSHDSKPRLSKDQQEQLEKHYQKNTKPTTAAKKEFSDLLGVSVEKINNWFQNRRAKTKQDFKKKQEQSLYQYQEPGLTDSFGPPLADDSYIDNAFYQTMGIADRRRAPGDARLPMTQSRAINESHGHYDPAMVSAQPPIAEEPTYGEESNFLTFFGLEGSEGSTAQADLDGVSALSKQFNPPPDHFDPAPRFAQLQADYQSSVPLPSLSSSSHNNSLSHLNQPYDDEAAQASHPIQTANDRSVSSSGLSGNTDATESRDPPMNWPAMHSPFGNHNPDPRTVYQEAMKTQMQWNADGLQHGAMHSTSTQSPDFMDYHSGSLIAQGPVLPSQSFPTMQGSYPQQEPSPSASTHRPSFPSQMSLMHSHQASSATDAAQSGQVEVPSNGSFGSLYPAQPHQGQVSTNTDYPMDLQPFARCDSGTSLLAESMDQVDLEHLSQNPTSRSAQGSSGLAMRRQRRPAALGQAALRSVSYTNGPVSALDPNTKHGVIPDAHLRRIKSSTGVLNGRIQKSSTSPAQRSPFSGTFAEASAAHRPRHFSNHSLGAFKSPPTEAFKTPTTPGIPQAPTPHLHLHHPSNESNRTGQDSDTIESVWSAMPDTAATTSSSIYHSLPLTANTAKSYLSSPGTPMDHAQMAQFNVNPNPSYHDALSPQSAPPWQPQFAPPFSHYAHMTSPTLPPQWNPSGDGSGREEAGSFTQPQMGSHHSSPLNNSVDFTPPSAYPLIHASQDYPSGHSRQSYSTQSEVYQPSGSFPGPMPMQMAPYMQSHSPPQQQNFTFPAHSESNHSNDDALSVSSGGQTKPKQEIQFQQYEPREPADPSSLPPKARNTPPKGTYTFHNIMPDSFLSSPKPASSPLKIACDVDEMRA